MEAESKGTLPGCSEACGANSFADASEEADLSREIFYAEAHPFFEAQLQRTLVSGSLAFRRCKSADKRGQTKACFQFVEREQTRHVLSSKASREWLSSLVRGALHLKHMAKLHTILWIRMALKVACSNLF